jgi:hypothetical protein
MADPEFVNELARRAGVSRADAEAVLAVLAQFAPEHLHAAESSLAADADISGAATTSGGSGDVEALIAEAAQHPLGLEFLLEGDLAAVAITFRTHVFTVEEARSRGWRSQPLVTGDASARD